MAGNEHERCAVRFLIFAASLRDGSLNDRLARLAADVVAAKGGTADFASMREFDCPSYDQDAETDSGVPVGAQRLRDRMIGADAFIIASPEYNAS
ncbi:MAG TPA: NAD(P)H-dependent oxidoreductase, partial [Gemmatimonadaceae bacterium]|nr:NAD(P)H-dependent oxidoreductase [Gemmatimonadaceae bacterium]